VAELRAGLGGGGLVRSGLRNEGSHGGGGGTEAHGVVGSTQGRGDDGDDGHGRAKRDFYPSVREEVEGLVKGTVVNGISVISLV